MEGLGGGKGGKKQPGSVGVDGQGRREGGEEAVGDGGPGGGE